MQYLAQWRMQPAARMLLAKHAMVATIALQGGYALAPAFKRLVGKPPAAWRRGIDRPSNWKRRARRLSQRLGTERVH